MKTAPHQSTKSQSSRQNLPGRLHQAFQQALKSTLELGSSLLSHLDSKTRLVLSIMTGMGVFLLLPDSVHLDLHILIAWISGVLCFLTLVVLMMCSATPQKTRYRSLRQEAQHLAVFLLVVMTACTSIFAIGLIQANANTKDMPPILVTIEVALSLVAVVCSWFLTHTAFALHYATCYYRPDYTEELGYVGGLDFPGEEMPDYWDFMYFSFTIGMTAQTSDVSIPSLSLRKVAIAHGIVSFFFYVVILASSVNIAVGLM